MVSQSRPIPLKYQSLVSYLVGLLCLLGVGSLQIPHLNKLITRKQTAPVEEIKREVEAERLRLNLTQKLPTFGFDNLIANWVYLGFLQYFGDDVAREQTGYELSPAYFEIIVDRDPRFLGSYLSLTASVSLYAGLPEKSVALMAKGLKSMAPKIPPKSYYVWRYKATDELLFLENIQSAQQSFAKAGEWASVYNEPESQNVAALSLGTAKFLAGNPDKRRIRIAQENSWGLVLTTALNTNDLRTRDQVIRRIEARGGKVTITPEGGVRVELP